MNLRNKIIVIGGYGAVGKYICHYLNDQKQVELVVAGRNLSKAQQYAQDLAHASARLFDIQTPDYSVIQDAALLILCVENKDHSLAAYCLSEGIHYLDITANSRLIQDIEQLNQHIPNPKSLVLLSVGLAPGLSNLLAKHCINRHLQSEWADINILLGLGEKHGYAAFEWTFDNMHTAYYIRQDQQSTRVRSFSLPQSSVIDKKRRFFLFNFSDQHSLAKLWPEKNVKTRMAFDSAWLTELLFLSRKIGLTKLLQRKSIQRLLYKLFNRVNFGSDRFAVQASCGIENRRLYQASFSGKSEAKITAAVAAELAIHVIQHPKTKTGVLHIHDYIEDIPAFITKVVAYDREFASKL